MEVEGKCIDIMKFFMALMVVTIHTNYFKTIDNVVLREPLIALICNAVPFFYITSGYFISRNLIRSDNNTRLSVKR